jgi:hypothetical protein
MRMILIMCCFLSLLSNVFSQPNNGVSFINNLPNMTVGQSMEIIIDGNGGGGLSIVVDNLEGNHNCAVERWEFISGNWILTNSTINNGIITFLSGQKMIAIAMSDSGNNPCSTVSGEDHILGNDFAPVPNDVDKIICVSSQILPVRYFRQPSAKLQNNQTHITWSIASQLNNEKYIIEHSNPESFREALTFSPIGEIAGDGISNETKHYTFIHKKICDDIYTVGCISYGVNYYRIKQVDYDGNYSYSDIASVRFDGDGETSIYPNPATSQVNISTTVPTTLQIMDVYGRVLTKQDLSEGQNTINLSEHPSGILIFAVGDQRFKVLKE